MYTVSGDAGSLVPFRAGICHAADDTSYTQMTAAVPTVLCRRVSFDKDGGDGWFLLRLSLHDPVIPINIESNIEGGLKTIANKLYDFVKQYDKLNLSALEKAI